MPEDSRDVPMWARLLVLFTALALFVWQVGDFLVTGMPANPILAPLSVALVGAAAGLVLDRFTGGSK